MNTQETYHKPVLVSQVINYLAPAPEKLYIDVTFGGGGHSQAILDAEPTCRVIALDWDQQAIEINGPRLEEKYPGRFKLLWGNFAHLKYLLKKENITQVDGILADFGTSQHQIFTKAGFSFAQDSPLDMRMSPAHQITTAKTIINYASEKELATIFYDYGEEPASRAIARAIVAHRAIEPIETTGQLVKVIETVRPRKHYHAIHPATRVFQSLRIIVNKELENISAFLSQALTLLAPHGRLVCISFHSLEDRIVKQFFRDHKQELIILTPKIITADLEELNANPSSRSAKLRAAERKS